MQTLGPPTEIETRDRPGRKGARCPSCGIRIAEAGCAIHGRPKEWTNPEVIPGDTGHPLPQFRNYRTERILGRGGFGTVYAAVTAFTTVDKPGRRVAIKLARADKPSAARRLAHELVALRLVGPPYVPEVIDAGELEPGLPYIVMELVEARTLAQILASRGAPLSPLEVCAFADALLGPLEAVHAEGLVHADMKPENVLLEEPRGRATVLDLGLSRRAGRGIGSELRGGEEGEMIGTIEYMAPEQCAGRSELDARADVYAVGCILYEMLLGHPPFWGPPAAVREGHLSRRPARFAAAADGGSIPASLEDVVLRCLEKDPRARWPNAAELRREIARVSEAVRTLASMRDPTPSEARPKTAALLANERRTVSLLHFTSPLDPIALRGRIESIGGHVMRASGSQYVVAFGHEADENPARISLSAARDLVSRGICERVWVDLATVSVTMRPDGSKRLVCPELARTTRAPLPEGGAPILLSPAARAVLTDADLGAAWAELGSRAVEEADFTGRDEPTTRLGNVGPPFVGRDELLEALAFSALGAVREETPSIAVVIGEAGHGKSYLRRLLVDRLRALVPQGMIVDLRAREPVVGGGDSVRDLLSLALGLPAKAPPEGRKALLRDRLGPTAGPEAEAALALALGWIDPQRTDDTTDFPGLRAIETAPFALGAALRVGGGEALRRRAERSPLCVILDDAHFADEATLSVLEAATLAEARAPIFVCALCRPVFRESHPSWGERAARSERFELGPLDAASAAALCRALLQPAEHVPASAVSRLVERTQGIPLLLVELVRGLKRAGIVRRHPAGRGFYLATDEIDRVPDLPLIEWLAHREIAALSLAERAHARLVAMVGAEVTPEEISGILRGVVARLDHDESEFPLDARIGIDRLLAAGVLRRQRQGRVGFRHALVRDAIAAGVPEVLRRKIHLAAADYYRDVAGTSAGLSEDLRLPQLAFHAARAGLREVAEDAYLALARGARTRHAYVDAERFYTLALEQSASGERRREAFRGRGLMRYRVGRYHDALVDFAEARVAAREAGDVLEVAEILLDEATALDWMGEHVASREKVMEAKALVEGRATPALHARLLLGIGRSHFRFSCPEDALVALKSAASEARALGEDAYETHVIAVLMLGFLEQGMGRLDEAEQVLDQAIALCDSHGDALHLASSLNNRGALRAMVGDSDGMVGDFERVIALGRELGQDHLEYGGHMNLAEFLYLMANLEEAETHVARARAMDERRPAGVPRPECKLLEARIRLYRGDLERARLLAETVRGGGTAPLTVPSDDVLCSMIELASGEATDEAWDALEERSRRYSSALERIEVVEIRGLWALRHGRYEEARRHLERALELSRLTPSTMGERIAHRLAEARRAAATSDRKDAPILV